MTQVENAFDTYEAIGNREDLINTIYDISPTQTPFMSGIARASATATLHEWQTDILAAAADDNAQLEGDEVARAASLPTTRLNNSCQISRKDATVTGTQDVVDKAGRTREMAYQMMKRTKELKRDMESSLLANTAKDGGDATTARVLAGIESWIATNFISMATVDATGAPTGDGTDVNTPGASTALTEDALKVVLEGTFNSGGEPGTIMVGAALKGAISAFVGRTQARQSVDKERIQAAASIYAGDFGDQMVVPNRFQVQTSVLVLEMDLWATAFLRSFVNFPLGKIGDADTRVILSEYTLQARNEAGSGIIAGAIP